MENYSIPMPFIECPKCGAEIPLRRDWKLRKKYHDFLKAKVPQLVRDLQ
jgi:adenine-specific DNA methylase